MTVNYSRQVLNFLQERDIAVRKKVVTAINELPAGNLIKLRGVNEYRLDIEEFRILFYKKADNLFIEKVDMHNQM